MDLVMEAVERGLVPDSVVRAGIRRLLARKLADERAGGADAVAARRAALLRGMRGGPLALHTDAANRQHYELPPAFFETVLGARLKYSSGLWAPGVDSLDEAEDAMLALTAARAGLEDGQRVLELGCGWGSLSLWMAERFPRSSIVAVSNAAAQRRFILARAEARGLGNLSVVTADMNDFDPGARFDRVVSVEMFEHLRDWPRMFARVATWLTPGGAAFLHVFSHRELAWTYEVDGASDWMARHFFTGGLMPSHDLIAATAGPLRVAESWRVDGTHYARTCEAWLARFDARREALRPLFAATYGAADAARWMRRWRVFFLACTEMFAAEAGAEWGLTHARLVARGERA